MAGALGKTGVTCDMREQQGTGTGGGLRREGCGAKGMKGAERVAGALGYEEVACHTSNRVLQQQGTGTQPALRGGKGADRVPVATGQEGVCWLHEQQHTPASGYRHAAWFDRGKGCGAEGREGVEVTTSIITGSKGCRL